MQGEGRCGLEVQTLKLKAREGGGINREKRHIMEKNESGEQVLVAELQLRVKAVGEKKKMERFSLDPLRLSRGAFDRY